MNRMCLFALLLVMGGCQAAGIRPNQEYALREVRRYGWFEAAEGESPTSMGVPRDAGVLGFPAGVVRGRDGTTFVLDAQFKRIVGFGLDGAPERVILGGSGDGPGEFRFPTHMAARQDELTVIDSDLGRVSVFAQTGSLVESFSLTHPGSRLAWLGDTAWVPSTGRPGVARPFARGYGQRGEPIAVAPEPDTADQAWGEGLGVSAGQDGTLIVNSARPGVWREYRAGTWSMIGEPLFPEVVPPVVERTGERQLRVTPAQVAATGVGLLGDSIVVQLYWRFTRPFSWEDPPGRDEMESHIGVFTRGGLLLGDVFLTETGLDVNHFEVDPDSSHIFLFVSEPYPQVVEYVLETHDS